MQAPKPLILLPLALALCAIPVDCQELAPRAYWPAPKGTKIFSAGYSYTDGDVLVDPSLPLDDVESEAHGLSLGYYQIFGLAGRTAGLSLTLPTVRTNLQARLGSNEVNRRLSGVSDLQIRLGVNFLGAPAMTQQEFQAYRQGSSHHIFGASLKLQVPTGDYNSDRVANIGSSRWSAKPELGYIQDLGTRRRWAAETAVGAWLYADNTDFLGLRLEQAPILSAELHLVRRISPGRWLSFDFNYYNGGRTTIGGIEKDNEQESSRIGATFTLPIKRNVWRLAVSDSWAAPEGGGYLNVLLSYSFVWN